MRTGGPGKRESGRWRGRAWRMSLSSVVSCREWTRNCKTKRVGEEPEERKRETRPARACVFERAGRGVGAGRDSPPRLARCAHLAIAFHPLASASQWPPTSGPAPTSTSLVPNTTPSLFTLSPASKRWIVDRSTLHQARSDDLQYVDNPEYLGFLNIFFANREPISPVQPLAPVSSLIVPPPSQ